MKRTALTVAISLLLLGTTPHEALALYVEEQPVSDTQTSGDTSQPASQPSPGGSSAPSEATTASEPTTQTRPTTESEQPTTESSKPTSSETTTASKPATTTSGPTTTTGVSEAATPSGPTTVSKPTTPSEPTTTTTTSDKPVSPIGPTTVNGPTTSSGPAPTSDESESDKPINPIGPTTVNGSATSSGSTTTTSGPATTSGESEVATPSGPTTASGPTTTTTTASGKPTQNGPTTTTTTSGKPTQNGPTTTATTSGKPTQNGPTTTTTTSGKPTTSGPTTTASEGEQASNSGTTNNTPCNCPQGGQTTQSGPTTPGGKQPVTQPGQTAGGTSSSGKQQPSQGGQAQPGGQPSQTGQATDQTGQASTCEKNHQGKYPSRPCNKPHRPKLQDFGLAPEQVQKFSQLSAIVLQAFNAHQMGRVPAKAFQEMTAQQMAELPKEAVSGLTPEQFQEMPAEAVQGLTADNVSGLSPKVIGKFKPKHFAKLNQQQFQQMSSKDMSKLLTQCDSTEVKPEDVKDLLPANWKLNQDDGSLQPPAGTQLALPTKQPVQQSSQVKLPQNLPDFGKGFGVGGRHPVGHSVLAGLNQGLAQAGYPQFTIQQSDQGVLTVKGSAEFQGTDLTFIPGKDMTQADETASTGLSSDDSGQYVVTTPEKQQFPVVPAPKDPAAMSDALGGQGTVEVGQEGDVLLKDSTQNQTVVGICDPVVTPAPANAKPGLHYTQQQNGKQVAQFVYKDGTMQTIHPTVLQPARFIEQTMATFDGVEKVVHRKDDGSFDVTVNGQALSVTPNFEVTETALPDNTDADTIEPQVTACSQQPSCLEYTVPHDQKLLTMKLQVNLPQGGQAQPTTTTPTQGGQPQQGGQAQPTTPSPATGPTTETTVAEPTTGKTTVAQPTTPSDHSGGAPCSSCHGN